MKAGFYLLATQFPANSDIRSKSTLPLPELGAVSQNQGEIHSLKPMNPLVGLHTFQSMRQVIAAWRSAGVWSGLSVATLAFMPLPRLAGVTFARYLLFGAKTPLQSVRSASGKNVYSWQEVVSDSRRGNCTANLSFDRYGEYTTVESGSQTYGAEVLTDVRLSYLFNDRVEFYVLGNNVFDVTPDEVTNSSSRGGLFESAPGLEDMGSPTVFKYSRRSAPFGFNGAYWGVGVRVTY